MFINMTSIKGEHETTGELRFIDTERKYRVCESVEGTSYNLIAAAIDHGLILVGLPDCTVIAAKTAKLLKPETIPDLNNILFTFKLSFKPQLLSVSQHGFGSVLLVSGRDEKENWPVMELFNLDTRESIAKLEVPSQVEADIVECQWNPIYHDSIAVLCTSSGSLLVVALCKDKKRAAVVYEESKYGVLTCCWSPKGKNLAIGMLDGQVMRLEPELSETSFKFKEVENSNIIFTHDAISGEHRIVKLNWIKQKILLCVHAKLNDANGPESVYSLVSIKLTDPLIYWSGVSAETFSSTMTPSYYPVNLLNAIVCASSSASEILVLAPKIEEPGADKLPDWRLVQVDDNECRINLPVESKENATFARGFTVTFMTCDITKPILVLYTNTGVLCSYICDSVNPLNLPPLLEPQVCPIDIPKPPVKELPPVAATPKPAENGKPYTIKEEEDGDDGLDLPITPLKSCPRESISQWSVERMKRNMSVKSLVSSMERQRR